MKLDRNKLAVVMNVIVLVLSILLAGALIGFLIMFLTGANFIDAIKLGIAMAVLLMLSCVAYFISKHALLARWKRNMLAALIVLNAIAIFIIMSLLFYVLLS